MLDCVAPVARLRRDVLCRLRRALQRQYVFNKTSNRTKARKAPEDWIIVDVPPIVSSQTFDAITAKRHERAPTATPPRVLNSPTLLTGLLKCAVRGTSMTLMTGKYGKYR